MSQANGRMTQEEMEEYGIPLIMLLDNSNSRTGSGGGTATGSTTYTWSVSWTENGFTNISWNVGTWGGSFDWENSTDAEIEAFLEGNNGIPGANIANSMSGNAEMVMGGCGGITPT